MSFNLELAKIFEQKFTRQEAEKIVTLLDTHSTDLMQQIYMTKDDKIDLIDRINSVNDRFEAVNYKFETVNKKIEAVDRKFDAFENKLFHKMESNFRWLVTLALTAIFGGLSLAATIIRMTS